MIAVTSTNSEKTRRIIKIIMEIRENERLRGSRRSIDDLLKIAELARLSSIERYEVLVWGKEERVLKVRMKEQG